MLQQLSFRQSKAELMVRIASTLLFKKLLDEGSPSVLLSNLVENPQYGYTASAALEEVGPKFVRITDLQDAKIDWDTVPYCKCDRPNQYLLSSGDILFARTGATTGKTYLVQETPSAIFASYLIRIRPKKDVLYDYLYSFFQSDLYWSQIIEGKEGSAQPNVNGQKLINIQIPLGNSNIQTAISDFLKVVRARQDGASIELPKLPAPLAEQRRIVARLEHLAAKIEHARALRLHSASQLENLLSSAMKSTFDFTGCPKLLGDFATVVGGYAFPSGGYIEQGSHQIVRIGNVRDGYLDTSRAPVFWDYENNSNLYKYELKEGDIVISMTGTRNKRDYGYIAIVPTGLKLLVNQRVGKIVLNKPIYTRYLFYYLRSPFFRDNLFPHATGTANQANIGNKDIESIPFNPPESLEEQRHIVAHLDQLSTRVEVLRHLQTHTARELDALLPSLLDRAFKGEL
jgi:type I restriction enzyme S subunit